ncbi:hypothetical protein CBR65_01090 [Cellvibrio sp. PSBB006]|nr:hypothetical protein CBR65_01090 [Cellvibrio sp. PSBB006]
MHAKRLLKAAHWSMAVTLILSLSIIYLAYGSAVTLSIPVQVILHILLIIFPAIFKISYVARLNALKQLGRPIN